MGEGVLMRLEGRRGADPQADGVVTILGLWARVPSLALVFIGLGYNSACLPQLTQLLVLGKYWGCMQRLASCPDSWLPRVPGADAEVEAMTALASLSVGILAEDR